MFMYVCMCIYMCVCVCMYVYVCVCVYVCVYVCVIERVTKISGKKEGSDKGNIGEEREIEKGKMGRKRPICRFC